MTAAASTRRSFLRRKRTWFIYLPLSILVLALATAALCWHLAKSEPSWYRPITIDDPHFQQLIDDPHLVPDAHNAVERAPLGDQTFTIDQDALNATITEALAIESGEHLAKDAAPVIFFTDGHVTLAARVNRIPGFPAGGIVTAQYGVAMVDAPPLDPDPHRRLQLTLQKVWLGQLRIPLSVVKARQAEMQAALEPALLHLLPLATGNSPTANSSRAAELHDALTHAIAGEPFVPFFYVPKKRPLVLKDLRLTDNTLTLTIGLR